MEHIADERLELLLAAFGGGSTEATALTLLRHERPRDRQVFAFRVGAYYMIGPMPDAVTELMVLIAQQCAPLTVR